MNNAETQYVSEDYLSHEGTKKHSGRYPYGSGKYPRAAIRNGDVVLSAKRNVKKVKSKVTKAAATALDKYKTMAAERKARREVAKQLREETAARKRLAIETKKQEEQAERDRAAKENEKEQRLKNLRDPMWVQRHLKELTDDEIDIAITRFNKENTLRRARLNRLNAGKDYLDFIMGYGQTGLNAAKLWKSMTDFNKDSKKKDPYTQEYAKKLLKEEVAKHKKANHNNESADEQLKDLEYLKTLENYAKGIGNNKQRQKQKQNQKRIKDK